LKIRMSNEEPPAMVMEVPRNYERTHLLAACPLCHKLDPIWLLICQLGGLAILK
jgi:hypothetical protein